MYYETCIRRAPHTGISEKCFQRYEANVYFGYTGSGGTSIPEDIAAVMKELKDLSKPGQGKGKGLQTPPAKSEG
jgi:hypothetical protein